MMKLQNKTLIISTILMIASVVAAVSAVFAWFVFYANLNDFFLQVVNKTEDVKVSFVNEDGTVLPGQNLNFSGIFPGKETIIQIVVVNEGIFDVTAEVTLFNPFGDVFALDADGKLVKADVSMNNVMGLKTVGATATPFAVLLKSGTKYVQVSTVTVPAKQRTVISFAIVFLSQPIDENGVEIDYPINNFQGQSFSIDSVIVKINSVTA